MSDLFDAITIAIEDAVHDHLDTTVDGECIGFVVEVKLGDRVARLTSGTVGERFAALNEIADQSIHAEDAREAMGLEVDA